MAPQITSHMSILVDGLFSCFDPLFPPHLPMVDVRLDPIVKMDSDFSKTFLDVYVSTK